MDTNDAGRGSDAAHEGWDIEQLWEKYEDIAMHFNDLIMRLRTQALAGVAALATLVGIFAKENSTEIRDSWEIAALVFFGLSLFWVAIWFLDFAYYNRLLSGAVAALKELEHESEITSRTKTIRMSTMIENVAQGKRSEKRTLYQWFRARWGILAFYIIVLFATVAGGIIALEVHSSITGAQRVSGASGTQNNHRVQAPASHVR